jgi:hypothetical protein
MAETVGDPLLGGLGGFRSYWLHGHCCIIYKTFTVQPCRLKTHGSVSVEFSYNLPAFQIYSCTVLRLEPVKWPCHRKYTNSL